MNRKITMILMLMSVFFMTKNELRAADPNDSDPSLFITEWQTNDGQITIPTIGTGYNYDVTWTNTSNAVSSTLTGVNGTQVIGELEANVVYEVAISGDFPRIYFHDNADRDKIIAISQWGTNPWTSMHRAFSRTTNLEVTAQDTPNLTNVTDMGQMFQYSGVTGSEGNWNWNTENVERMNSTFFRAYGFNADISGWNTANVTRMNSMFYDAHAFNQNLGNWDLSSLTKADQMFRSNIGLGMDCENFGNTIRGWNQNPNTPSGITLGAENRTLPVDISVLDVAQLGNGKNWVFEGLSEETCGLSDESATFNTEWIVDGGSVTIPTIGSGYGYYIEWNNKTTPGLGDGNGLGTGDYVISGDFNEGDVIEVKIAGSFPRIYFHESEYRDNIIAVTQWGANSWTSMHRAFSKTTNLEITAQDTPNLTNVTDMGQMFQYSGVTGSDANWNWNTENVVRMNSVFFRAYDFNADISAWNTANVTRMNSMFYDAHAFNQNLGNWDISSLTKADQMFRNDIGVGMDCENFGSTIRAWKENPNTPSGITLGAEGRTLPIDVLVLDVPQMSSTKNWTFNGLAGEGCGILDESSTFNSTWVVSEGALTIPTFGTGYNYYIEWTNATTPGAGEGSGVGGDSYYVISSDFNDGDTIEVRIVGDFPRIYFYDSIGADASQIIAVTQWGTNEWTSMKGAFSGTINLEITAQDTPNLSNVTDMGHMFQYSGVTGSQGNWNWNTENAERMNSVFFRAHDFNGDISGWNTGNVTRMTAMFYDAHVFNSDISGWNTENVYTMERVFLNANSFNQNLGAWNVSSLDRATNMFDSDLGLGMDCENFGNTLSGWANSGSLLDNVVLGAKNREVALEVFENEVPFLTDTKGWSLVGLLGACDAGEEDEDPIDTTPMSAVLDINNALDITVYPNPTDGVFTLVSEEKTSYVVMDIYGRTILTNQITDSKTTIDLSTYPRGIYYVQVGDNVQRVVLK